jgi:hypothetical protein
VFFSAFRTKLDDIVVQPSGFELGTYACAVLKLFLFRAKCIFDNNKTLMGRTWVDDVSTMFYKIRNYLDHPHILRF